MRFLARSLAWIAILGPPLFLVAAVQHGALTHPFSDYCKLIPLVEKLQDGTLSFADLLAPLNQNRPATWRALLLANARLTGWDIRSEYVYLLAALIGAFLVQVQLLRRSCAACPRDRRLLLVAVLSIVSFSPAAHNNHWWSMLIQFDLGHLFIVTAFALVSWRGDAWRAHALAALACWLAAYTVTTGLVAFVSCAIVAQLFSSSPRRPTRLTLFWIANIVLVVALYVPGLPEVEHGLPSLERWAAFVLVYLGSPAASLLWFPFQSQFDIPSAASVTARNAVAGVVLLTMLAAKTLAIVRAGDRSTGARACFAFSLFAVGAAVLTGMGRAEFGPDGLANASASRFVLFGSYVLYACLYAAAVERPGVHARAWTMPRPVRIAAMLIVLACVTVTYARSWSVYDEARRFDRLLAVAYGSGQSDSPFDELIYPVRSEIAGFKATLRRLRLGPYRDAPESDALEQLAKTKVIDQFGINGLRPGPDGLILFAHPHSRFSIPVSRAVAVTFRYGVMANATSATPPTDGVEFRILAPDLDSEAVLWSSVWRPAPGAEYEHLVTIALPRFDFSGPLIFETLTAGRFENDWAYWADLGVVRHQ
jgi:hypothetical protein